MISDRTIGADEDAELDKPLAGIGVLFWADFIGDPVYMWTGNYPLSYDGQTWHGVAGLVGVSAITESLDGSSQGIAVSLSGLEHTEFSVETLGDYQGRSARVYLAMIDPELETVVGDPVLLFEGLMDSDATTDDGDSLGVTINVERRDSDQLRPRPLRYTHEDQRMLTGSGTDIGLTFVTAVQADNLLWGVGQ